MSVFSGKVHIEGVMMRHEVKEEQQERPKDLKSESRRQWNVGRAPWYNQDGKVRKPFIIGVTGGSASGKTTVCAEIIRRLGLPWVVLLSMDRFYRSLTPEESKNCHNYNFDHPDAFDWDGLRDTVKALSSGRCVQIPRYCFKTHSRETETDTLYGADVIIVEGILVLHSKEVRDQFDMKIYVDEESDIRLARRIKRDIIERGRSVEDVIRQYVSTVKPSFDDFILPTKRHADLIIPRGGDNYVAIDMLCQNIKAKLDEMGVHFSPTQTSVAVTPDILPPNFHVLESTHALKAIHTIVRDSNTLQEDFIFNVNRLTRLLLSDAMNFICCQPYEVTTPTGAIFSGCKPIPEMCVVTVTRGGGLFENSMTESLPQASFGTLVIGQKDSDKDAGPRLYFCKFPSNISQTKVLLLDAVLATGNAISMAVYVLLEHHVPLENIQVVSIAAAPQGLQQLQNRFPGIRCVTSWIDEKLDDAGFLCPGFGHPANRYFGTEQIEEDDEQ